jgi:hypothetical protein
MSQPSIRQLMKQDYAKCISDPVYFMKKYCKIQHPTKGRLSFELYPFQEKVLHDFKNHRYNIVLKSRQMGISTLVAGYSMWLINFFPDKNVLVIATTQETAKNLVTKVREMYSDLPTWLKPKTTEDNRLSLRLDNGSQIKAVSSSPDAARGQSLSLLVLDEASFIDSAENIWIGAQSTLSTGGDCIILSTPNGVGGFFHKTWLDAEQGLNTFNTIKLKWNMHPEYDQTWRDEQEKLLGPKKAAQECDASFLSSGNTVIDTELILWYKQESCKEPLEKRGFDRNYWLWEYPQSSKQYIVVADVARGDASDFSTFHVIESNSVKQVAEYRGKLPPREFGRNLVSVAIEWNNALLVIENSNVGYDAIQEVINQQYLNLFYMQNDLQYIDAVTQVNNKINHAERKQIPGFTTSSRTRPLIISRLDAYFRDKSIIIQSTRLIEELLVFVWNNARAEAMKGYNDDLVMALAIGLWVRDTSMKLREEGLELQKMALDRMSTTLSTTGWGAALSNKNTGYKEQYDKIYQLDAGKEMLDLSWLK